MKIRVVPADSNTSMPYIAGRSAKVRSFVCDVVDFPSYLIFSLENQPAQFLKNCLEFSTLSAEYSVYFSICDMADSSLYMIGNVETLHNGGLRGFALWPATYCT